MKAVVVTMAEEEYSNDVVDSNDEKSVVDSLITSVVCSEVDCPVDRVVTVVAGAVVDATVIDVEDSAVDQVVCSVVEIGAVVVNSVVVGWQRMCEQSWHPSGQFTPHGQS